MITKRRLRAAQLMAPLLLLAGCPGDCSPAPAPETRAIAPTAGGPPSPGGTPAPAGAQFFEDFSTPEGFYNRFQTQVKHASDFFSRGETWNGDHNMACQGPDTGRMVHGDVNAELFWWCAPKGPESGHVMTSMGNMSGYSIVAFAPNQAFPTVNKVCFDVNLTVMSRKWFEVLIVPEAAYQASGGRLDFGEHFGGGSPATDMLPTGANVVVLEGTGGSGLTINHQKVVQQSNFDAGADVATRYKQCFWDNGNGTVGLSQQTDSGTTTLSGQGSFPDGPARVIFSDHSYDPGKDGSGLDHGTWHWDNIEVG